MKRKTTVILAAVTFLLALGLTIYPFVSIYVSERYASEIYFTYEEAVEQTDDLTLEQARLDALRYNESIIPGALEEDEAFSQEALEEASGDYDKLLNITGNGIMGYVEIPVISVKLPIYHGTGADSLERGVGHLLGSSLPVGGESTHTELTGHSGMATSKMFTDLEQLKQGDVFYLHTLGETLAYQVSEMNTVLPHETELLAIVPEEDYCTLVTCVPYAVNSHRLLVRGERIPYEEAETMVEEITVEELPASRWEEKYFEGIFYGIAAASVVSAAIIAFSVTRVLSDSYSRSITTLQLLPSPYAEGRAVLVVGALDDDGMLNLRQFLKNAKNVWKLQKDTVLIDSEQEVRTFELAEKKAATATPLLKRMLESNEDTAVFTLVSTAVMLLFLLAGILILIRIYWRQKK